MSAHVARILLYWRFAFGSVHKVCGKPTYSSESESLRKGSQLGLTDVEREGGKDLDSLSRARDLTAKEHLPQSAGFSWAKKWPVATPRLTTVQEELSSSKQAGDFLQLQHDLEHAHEELRVLQKKLELCREAVVTAVKSIDAVYEEVPDEDGKDANLSRDEAQQLRGHQAKQKAANAMDADKAISELLAVVGNPATILPDKEVVEEKYKTSGENADCGASPALEKLLEMKVCVCVCVFSVCGVHACLRCPKGLPIAFHC
ncbi:unnamed protein product [Symbiodinium sp. CCMP2592]|nr:unnamed protein product [Symbiodinium sp. CCMP2592]